MTAANLGNWPWLGNGSDDARTGPTRNGSADSGNDNVTA